MESILILGRQPAISAAELESLYGANSIKLISNQALLLDKNPVDVDFERLGASIKLGQILSSCNYRDLKKTVSNVVSSLNLPQNGKLNIGISGYGLKMSSREISAMALDIKKELKSAGYSVRVVPNKEASLNSAQVIHNKLTNEHGLELLLVASGSEVYIAKTIAVQNITDYTARDRERPKRDAFVGMLPPKLAQTIINLAVGQIQNTKYDIQNTTLLDPFCGTGVVLQEALLMGYNVIGTDIEPKMIDYSQQNIDWFTNHWPNANNDCNLEVGDACNHTWPNNISTIASETYLGRPLSGIPPKDKLDEIIHSVNYLHKKFLQNLAGQIASGTRLCIAVPAWFVNHRTFRLPVLDDLAKLGYNRVDFKHAKTADLIYRRPDQLVGRELVIMTRK